MTQLHPRYVILAVALLAMLAVPRLFTESTPDGTWEANAVVANPTTLTVERLGAIQGVSFRDGKYYFYGDVHDATPRVGAIREFTAEFQATGRVVWLRRNDQPLLRHPTGLTWHARWGTFMGDTVNQRAVIYRLDWQRAWEDGHLDRAVLDTIEDDAAVNGCRPEFVELNGQSLLASADYGNVRPEVRLYDPEKMLANKRTSAAGVVAHRFLVGPFNQNLHWHPDSGHLTCVQNVIAGRGWRLDTLDLAKAVADGRANGPGVRLRQLTFPPHNELEGYRPLEGDRALFATSGGKNNVLIGDVRVVPPRPSRPGR